MIFEVTPEDLEKLADGDLRLLVAHLAEEELSKQGHSTSHVTFGGHQNAKDGGLDVRVALAGLPTNGYVPRCDTGFQVKAANMAGGDIAAEMRPKGLLRPSIAELAAAKGAYIIVSSKCSLSDSALRSRLKAMKGALAGNLNSNDLLVDFYDRRRLASWVNQNPGLMVWVRSKVGRPIAGWQPFKDWSSAPTKSTEPYLADDSVRLVGIRVKNNKPLSAIEGINTLRNILRTPKGVVRLVGLSGVGKTRLVQALFDDATGQDALDKHLVVYADLADEPDPVPQQLFDEIQNRGKRCIFIVDNCGLQRANWLRYLANSNASDSILLVMSGLAAMMESDCFSSFYAFEFGARKRDYGFQPKTRVDTIDWYRQVINLVKFLAGDIRYRNQVRALVARRFKTLVTQIGIPDDFIELAESLACDGGWAEGWAGARAAARLAKDANQPEFEKKFQILADKLAPSSLAERITSYVLPEQWSALDVADIDSDDEKKYEKSQRQVADICSAIGRELAADLSSLQKHLPSMLLANTTRPLIIAETIGQTTTDPRQAWRVIVSSILSSDKRYIYSLAGSFLKGLLGANKELVGQLLDEALLDENLHTYFVQMQNNVGTDDSGVSHLMTAAAMDSVPIGSFRNLSCGGSLDDLSGQQIEKLILAIASREGGVSVALEILHMHYYSRQSEKTSLTAEEQNVGRKLLALVMFDNRQEKISHALGEVVTSSLRNPEDAAIARLLCERLNSSVVSYKVSAGDFNDFIISIAKIFPDILLDVFLDDDEDIDPEERRRTVFDDFRSYRPDPLRHISEEAMLGWAKQKPATRFIFLAAAIRPWQRVGGDKADIEINESHGNLEFTTVAKRLIQEAPNPGGVIRVISNGFYPSGWSGSLANIYESRIPLLESLLNDENSEIVNAANEALAKLKGSVEAQRRREANESRDRDERFEW